MLHRLDPPRTTPPGSPARPCRARPGWLRAAIRATFVVGVVLAHATPAQTIADATSRILALENEGRAQPERAAAELDALRDTTPEFSEQRLELLTVRGVMLASASRRDGAERSAAELAAWGAEPGRLWARSAAASALLVRARLVWRSGNLQQADALMREAMATLPDPLRARDRLRFVVAFGKLQDDSGKVEDAIRLHHEALALADRTDEPWRRFEARTALAYSYLGAKQLERARALVDESIAAATKAADGTSLARAHTVLALVLHDLHDVVGERRAYEAAIANARRVGSKVDEAMALTDLSDHFLQNEDYRSALLQAERALPVVRESHDRSSELVALANAGLAQIALKQFEPGKRRVHEAIAIAEERGSARMTFDLLGDLGLYLEKAGATADAVQAYHQYRRMAAERLRADQQKAILAMQEQYDAEQRGRALALLTRDNAIKAEQLHRRDLQQRLWILLASAFVLLFGIALMFYRRVRGTHRQLSSNNDLLKVQAALDPLTGLANRRHFQAAMRLAASDGKLNGTVYLIDIDHFKRINDRYGHAAGDTVLVEIARRLKATLRETDLIVRWGGEEFLVVVPSGAPGRDEDLAERMLLALEGTPVIVDGRMIAVSASIGFATFPIGPVALRVSWERAIDLVDTAMYLAKAHGRNRAYGVRLLKACDAATLESITADLEGAWRDGSVALTLLQGRTELLEAA